VKRTAFDWIILRPGRLTNNSGTGTASVGRAHLGKPISVYILVYYVQLCINLTPNVSETTLQKPLLFSLTERTQLVWQSMLLEVTPLSRTVWMPSSRKAKPTSWVDDTNENGTLNTCKYHSDRNFPRERLASGNSSRKKASLPELEPGKLARLKNALLCKRCMRTSQPSIWDSPSSRYTNLGLHRTTSRSYAICLCSHIDTGNRGHPPLPSQGDVDCPTL